MTVVDLCINVFGRTEELVLGPGYFEMVAQEHGHDFESRTLLVNNVSDLRAIRRRAEELVRRGEISRFFVVAEHLDHALAVTGLRRSDFGRVLHNSDCSLVALTLPGPDWLLYLDAEARLRAPAEWITTALKAMGADRRYLAASPQWEHPSGVGNTAQVEAEWVSDGVAACYGFSDQTFLVRRSDFAGPLAVRPLWLRAPGALWHPSHAGYFLETIIEARMRIEQRPKAVVLAASTVLDASNPYHPVGLRERVARKRNNMIVRHLVQRHWRHPRWRQPIPPGVEPHQRFPDPPADGALLVYDVGAHDGEDTAGYLASGYRVVAIEANPTLAGELERRFAADVAAARLTVLPVGIHERPGETTFFVSSNDQLSSFDEAQATQYGETATPVVVPLVPFGAVLTGHGVPHYLKVDIEGMDHVVIDSLRGPNLPTYISTEIDRRHATTVRKLRRLGYRRFKLIRQRDHQPATPAAALRSRLGRARAADRDHHSSGPFGEATPGWWLPPSIAWVHALLFLGYHRFTGRERWHDLHAWRR